MKKIISYLLLIVTLSILYSVEITNSGVLFSYKDENAQAVFLVGTMNNWNPNASQMHKDDSGKWIIVFPLDPGKYAYKFMIDGNWQFDQENPHYEDDGYGGSNSIIEIDNNGTIINYSVKSNDGVKSTFNPKIYFTGRYYVKNLLLKNETDRFMLNKPNHDLNFGIIVKFNSRFQGNTVLNVNNAKEGVELWKTHFNYKRMKLKLQADYFNIIAFDNVGLVTFDDPLHIVGNIGYNDYDFGYGLSGIYAESSNLLSKQVLSSLPISIFGQLFFSDSTGNTDDDISAVRVKFGMPTTKDDQFTIGVSRYQYITQLSTDVIQRHDNYAFDVQYKKHLFQTGWENALKVNFSAEYSSFTNSNEEIVESIWMQGENIFLGASIQFPAALRIYGDYLNTSLQLETYFSRERYTLGADFTIKNLRWDIKGQYWKNYLSDDLNWVNYYKYLEKTDGNGRWFQQSSEVPFEKYTVLGYPNGLIWESNLHYNCTIKNHATMIMLKNRFAHHNISIEPKFIENIFVIKFDISDDWKFKLDTRIPYYNDPFLKLQTDFSKGNDVFISNYYEVAYYLSKDVWLAIGYGVNPIIINSITDEFHDRGREEYMNVASNLSQYIESYYGGFGSKIREAELLLKNEKRISLQAIITF